ncbi:MAG: hypothetical protein JWN25_3602 [Verrucomicrobiales bacterium]|nr:hypothetical protein [Verrucomicrobiales bacterium]
MLKPNFFIGCALMFLIAGCAHSTVESRKKEQSAAYQALPDDEKQLVDKGQIRVGMSEQAVYISWGKPGQVLQGETNQGAYKTWLYAGTTMEENRYWSYRSVGDHMERFIDHDYTPRDYVRAEIVFSEGKVKTWRTLASP